MATSVAESARKILIQHALRGESVSYRDLILEMGHTFSRPKVRWICKLLGEIDSEGAERGEPELAVLVVRASDRLPGDGWWATRNRYSGAWEGDAAAKYVKRIQRQTFRFWQSRQSD